MVTNSGIFSTSTSITYLFKNFLSITRIFKAYLSKSQHKLKPFVWSVNLYSSDIVLKLLIVLFVLMMKYVPFLPKGGGIFSTSFKTGRFRSKTKDAYGQVLQIANQCVLKLM